MIRAPDLRQQNAPSARLPQLSLDAFPVPRRRPRKGRDEQEHDVSNVAHLAPSTTPLSDYFQARLDALARFANERDSKRATVLALDVRDLARALRAVEVRR